MEPRERLQGLGAAQCGASGSSRNDNRIGKHGGKPPCFFVLGEKWNLQVDNGVSYLYNGDVYLKKAVKRRVSRRSLSESPGWCDGAGRELPNMVSEPGCR